MAILHATTVDEYDRRAAAFSRAVDGPLAFGDTSPAPRDPHLPVCVLRARTLAQLRGVPLDVVPPIDRDGRYAIARSGDRVVLVDFENEPEAITRELVEFAAGEFGLDTR